MRHGSPDTRASPWRSTLFKSRRKPPPIDRPSGSRSCRTNPRVDGSWSTLSILLMMSPCSVPGYDRKAITRGLCIGSGFHHNGFTRLSRCCRPDPLHPITSGTGNHIGKRSWITAVIHEEPACCRVCDRRSRRPKAQPSRQRGRARPPHQRGGLEVASDWQTNTTRLNITDYRCK